MKKLVELKANTYSYLLDEGSEDKRGKGTKRCVIKKINLKILKTV